MDPEEQELQNDPQYRTYRVTIEKALRSFEYSSEWADLISSLDKLTKALQSNLKFSLLPERLIICKRLAQCLHPALPSGVHLKALETYEVIFKIIGTKWLAKDLFIYSSGLFPLLGHAAMAVRPVLLKLYERYFLPLQSALLPSLQAFVMGLLPGLEEGLEVYDRTDALMVKLSLLVGQHLFYGGLWGSIMINPLLRLPATSFIVLHFDRMGSGHEQRYMLGSNHTLALQAIHLALQDSNVLVQRNTLEILLFFFPLASCQDPEEACVPITQDDVVSIMSAASLSLLRRDLSLNRRMYAWLLGTDCKGGMVTPDPDISTTLERHTTFYFEKYSRAVLTEGLINLLEQKRTFTETDSVLEYLRPLKVIIILLDKPEIGTQVAGELMLEVIRALYRCCRGPVSRDQGTRENRNMAELLKTVNVLISSLGTAYLWDYMSEQFHTCLSMGNSGDPSAPAPTARRSPPPRARPSLSELSELITFLLDLIPLELYCEIQTHFLPQMLVRMLRALQGHMTSLSLSELTEGLNACLKVLTRIQTPVGGSGVTKEPHTPGEKENLAQGGMEQQENGKEVREEEEDKEVEEEGEKEVEEQGEKEQEAEGKKEEEEQGEKEQEAEGEKEVEEQGEREVEEQEEKVEEAEGEKEEEAEGEKEVEEQGEKEEEAEGEKEVEEQGETVEEAEGEKEEEAEGEKEEEAEGEKEVEEQGEKEEEEQGEKEEEAEGEREVEEQGEKEEEAEGEKEVEAEGEKVEEAEGEKEEEAEGKKEVEDEEEKEEEAEGEKKEEEEEDQPTEEVLETAELTGEKKSEEQENKEEEREDDQEEVQEEEQEVNGGCSVLTPPPQAECNATDLVTAPTAPTPDVPQEGLGSCPKRKEVWRQGGSMENMMKCVHDILASFIARHLLEVVGEEQEPGEAGEAEPPLGRAESLEPPLNPQLPETPPGGLAPDKQTQPDTTGPSGEGEGLGAGRPDWGDGLKARDGGGIPEACCQAFSAACHLLLECTTFPLYLSEEEVQALCACVFQSTGSVEDTLPLWLMSLMMCCLLKDHHVQHVAISTMLELVDRSQAIRLVIEDRVQRRRGSGRNSFSGRLRMVTAPPLNAAVLTAIAHSTDFYQRVAQVLWGQLDTERRELHIPSVELLYRLHGLAPSASICESIICQELLHTDKTVRLEALHRFSVLWHLTRETQTNVTMLLNRSFDRSLFVVLDNLNSPDVSISTTTQSWLIRALSLNDVIRILEPVLLLLLHPSTQSSSIQWVKQNLTVENLQQLSCRQWEASRDSGRSADAMATDGQSEESPLSHVTPVERAVLWGEMKSAPETTKTVIESSEENKPKGQGEEEEGEKERREEEKAERRQEEEEEVEERVSMEHSELAESYCSSDSLSPEQPLDRDISEDEPSRLDLRRADSAPTLGSEDEELEQEAMAHLRLLKQEKEKQEALESLFRHTLLYLQPHDSAPVCHALSVVEMLLRSCSGPFLQALCSTSIHPDSAHHRLICSLMQRHLQVQEGRSFYSPLLTPPTPPRPILLVELLTCLCLQFLRSFYPCYLHVDPVQLSLSRDLQVKSAEVLVLLIGQLVGVTGSQDVGGAGRRDTGMREMVWRLLSGCKVQRYALLALCTAMHISQRPPGAGPCGEGLLEEGGGVSEENLINLGGGQVWSQQALQVELMKLLQVLMVLEKQVWMGGAGGGAPGAQVCVSPLGWEWQEAALFQQSARSLQYVQTRPLPAQAMFVSAAARALQPCYGYTLHAHWVALISASLPYLGPSLAAISAPFITQICRNLDELVQQHQSPPESPPEAASLKKENMAPDYPLTLLDGLTTITHYCLLLHTRKTPVVPYLADFQDARDALLNELPRMLITMVMLWGVVQREEMQRSPPGSAFGPHCTPSCSRTSPTSVYFRSTKILKQKVLEFLNPLVAQFGVRVMASVGAVWGEPRSKGGNTQNTILPVATEFHQTVVELIKSLSMLSTNTILQLVKEVIRTKSHQAKGDQNISQVLPMLHFTYIFIQGIPAESLQDSIFPLLSLLKESVQLNLPPLGHFLLLGILNDFVNRFPNLDNKKDSREVQEVTQRVLEVVGGVAGSSLQQTSWLSRTLEVRAQPRNLEHAHLYDSETLAEATASFYSIQALALLAEVLAPLLDVVFRSDEKEKALPHISRLLDYVFPYLKNHCVYNVPSFCASARLLRGLSEYAYTKRAWRREAFDLYMDSHFFRMDPSCIAHWGSIIDHLMTYEKTLFKDLANMQSSGLKLSPNYEQKAMLLKRQAFAIISGELDQYGLYLPLIQERMTESLRVGQAPSVMAQIFLLFRVLLLRVSPQHLTSLWPVMVTELIHVFGKLEKTLLEGHELSRNPSKGRGAQGTRERNGPAFLFSRSELEMYLSACKFLDATLCFPPERIPLFQMYRWAFVPEVDVDSYSGPENSIMEGEQECQPHVIRVLDGLRYRYKELNCAGEDTCTEHLDFPLLPQRSISSLTQLEPFFRALSSAPKGPQSMADSVTPNSSKILSKLEEIIQNDFLENMDS